MAEMQEPPQNPTDAAVNPIYHFWPIQYSRFFIFPLLSSTSPALRPLTSRCLKKCSSGCWLSASSMASLLLTFDHKAAAIVLTVSLPWKVYEEHYISKLIFSWPQVSFLENCSVKGSRVVFASYRDSFGQVQKFAMRFSSASESQSFIHSLKEYYTKGAVEFGNTERTFEPKIESATENIFTQDTYLRPDVELSHVKPTGIGNNRPSIPSSYPALLVESCSEAAKGPNEAEMLYLSNQAKAMRYLPESSFNAMLMTLEMVIAELGGDLSL